MSHFAGLVILTPDYEKSVEDALEPYSENLSVPAYSKGEVSDWDKVCFIKYYCKNFNENEFYKSVYLELVNSGKVKAFEDQSDIEEKEHYICKSCSANEEDAVNFFKKAYPKEWAQFESLYKKHGYDWNGRTWKFNYVSGKWEEYSTYNPKSKWDWYDDNGGRWDKCIKTKSGEFVNQCLLEEIDWSNFKDSDYCKKLETSWSGKKYRKLKENVRWHFTQTELPFCFVVNGEWVEKGEMGWWAMTSGEMSNEEWSQKVMEMISRIPGNSEVYLVDFHI